MSGSVHENNRQLKNSLITVREYEVNFNISRDIKSLRENV